MEAIELRKKTDELEKQVKSLLKQFIEDVGECDIEIRPGISFIHQTGIEKPVLVNINTKIYVTV